jgi:putative ABC transport system permease protein
MKILDTLLLAFRTVRSNKLRTGLTVAIIAFGIMALVGINTAIDAMKQKFTESFASMGATGFTIRYKQSKTNFGDDGDDNHRSDVEKEKKGLLKEKKSNLGKPVTKDQAEAFKKDFKFPSKIGLSIRGVNDAIVSLGDKKTNPTVRIFGGDENYVELNAYTLANGRTLNSLDVRSGRNVCVIGDDIAKKFFGSNPDRPLEKIIRINSIPYRVIGTLEPRGSTFGMSWDNAILTSYTNVRRLLNTDPNTSFSVQVKVATLNLLDGAIGEAEGIFRPIRRNALTEESNFLIDKSDSFVETLLRNLSFITISAIVIGGITLIGAAVGLMNIMLVSVTERTKEIGLVKAIGGKQKSIRRQFLYESIIISLMGAGIGIILGIVVGNSFSIFLNTGFVFPWSWLFWGVAICSLVGLAAGLYPSLKASRLNPIEALRYE